LPRLLEQFRPYWERGNRQVRFSLKYIEVLEGVAKMILKIRIITLLPLAFALAIAAQEARSQVAPTTEQFDSMLRSCAAGANIEMRADIVGSIKSIYEGQRTQGLASFQTSTEFLKLIPENSRLEAYKLYTECIRDIVTKR
jgi:hypothetical protein